MSDILMVWGNNEFGQISGAPGNAKAIAPGGSINGLALSADGTPVIWGDGSMIVPPVGPVGPPAIPGALATETFKAVAIGRDDAVLIRANKTLAAFGRNSLVTTVPPGSYRAVAVAAQHAVAIAQDGTLNTWGANNLGVLNAPQGDQFKEVAARVRYSLALDSDGKLYFWGKAPYQYFLNGWVPTPQDPNIFYFPSQKFEAIAAGNAHALAIRPDGTVMGWGEPKVGALTPPAGVHFKAVAAGWGFSIGLDSDQTLWAWGTPATQLPTSQTWTFEPLGWARYGDGEHYYFPVRRFKSIAAAAFHIEAITKGS
jgi:alpha-tubulin suppressor-like RCC1 family protein